MHLKRPILAAHLVALLALPCVAQELRIPSTPIGTIATTPLGRIARSSEILGKNVKNSSDESLGEIDDIVVNSKGRISYAVLSFSTFLGLKEKLFAIPWSSLKLSADGKAYVLEVSKDKIKKAPGFDKKNWPNMADPQWSAGVDTYYGSPPVANAPFAGRLSELASASIKDELGEKLAKTKDLVIACDAGFTPLIVVSPEAKLFRELEDRYIAIPWGSCTGMPKDKSFVYGGERALLTSTPSFEEKAWPELTEAYLMQVYSHFGRDLNADLNSSRLASPVGSAKSPGDPARPDGSDSSRLGRRTICATKLIGATMTDSDQAEAGVVRDLILIPGDEENSFVVVDVRDTSNQMRVVPLSICKMNPEGRCQVATTVETVKSSPGVADGDLARLSDDAERCRQICDHYNATKPVK